MKKIILIPVFLFLLITSVKAQLHVGGKNVNEMTDVKYVELIVDNRLFQRQSFAVVDYGQFIRAFAVAANRVTDANGRDLQFNSEMDMFNHLYKNGWVHETTYAKDTTAFHIFKRREADSGLRNLGN